MAEQSRSFIDKYWRESRQTRYGTYLFAYVVVVLLLLGGLNYLANRFNKSYDTTASQRYTLSDQTRKVAQNLTADVRMRYFYGTGGPEAARDLLSRYDELSGRIGVEYVDIDQKPLEARTAGVTAPGEIVLSQGDRIERASSLSEEEITRALIRLTREGARTACVLQGSGEPPLETREGGGFSNLPVLLRASSIEIRPLALTELSALGPDCTVLIVAGPQTPYPPAAVNAIKSYVETGNAALFLIDPPSVEQGLTSAPNQELLTLLGEWGVEVQRNWIIAPGTLAAAMFGPLTVLVNQYEQHPITSTLGSEVTIFPQARGLRIAEGKTANVSPLFSSSQNSFVTHDLGAEDREIDLNTLERGPFVMAAAGTVSTRAPAPPPNDGTDAVQKAPAAGRFVVVGNSRWAQNANLGQYENRNLLANMINWLTSEEDLISIPPKSPSEATLVLTPMQLRMLNLTAIFLIPLLVVAAGVFVWLRRR